MADTDDKSSTPKARADFAERRAEGGGAHIARSIATGLGDAALVEKLAALPPSELSSLLLAVLRSQANARDFGDVRRQYDRGGALAASLADGRALARVERLFHEAAPEFSAVEIAPVAPLGLCAQTGIDQNKVLSAVRSLEVLADPTALLALEVARRRRPASARAGVVRLLSTARVLRMQPLPKGAAHFTTHFRLHCLVSGGRGGAAFESAGVAEHCAVWIRLLRSLDVVEIRVRISSSTGRADPALVAGVAAALAGDGGDDVAVVADDERTQGRAYYDGPMIGIDARAPDGSWFTPADGGAVSWMRALLDDQKERLFTSGFGAEFVVKRLAGSG